MQQILINKTGGGTERIHWLDALKVLGMYIIVTGHSEPPQSVILYVFSVQLFFIMSGFLFKPQPTGIFLKKILKQLVIPMLLLSLICNMIIAMIYTVNGTFTVMEFGKRLLGIIIGNQGPLGTLWFVYSLVIAKIISNYAPLRIKPVISIMCLMLSFYINEYTELAIQNCYVNALLAYPMFFFGEILSKYKNQINNIKNPVILTSLIIVGAAGVFISENTNDNVWMYLGQYGSNIGIFLIGGICGAVMCFAICKLLFDRRNKYITILAEGAILILAFQMFIIAVIRHFVSGYMLYGVALLIVLLFIPITMICKRYCPILIGYRISESVAKKGQGIMSPTNA